MSNKKFIVILISDWDKYRRKRPWPILEHDLGIPV
jgi:hypothetical protein